ncbi:MAG: DinB family protein [Chloroflexota bacterium]
MLATLRALYGYNTWATERLLEVAAGLTSEQWLAPGNAGRGSVRDTLVHQISAQRSWLGWWAGTVSADQRSQLRLDPAAFPDLPAVRAIWSETDQATRDFFDGLTDADLSRVYRTTTSDGRAFRLPLWQMMAHVANHGTQHRSEVAAMLTGFDRSPGDLDMLIFFKQFG